MPEPGWYKVSVSDMQRFRFVKADHDDVVDLEAAILRADLAAKVLFRIPVKKLLSSLDATSFFNLYLCY